MTTAASSIVELMLLLLLFGTYLYNNGRPKKKLGRQIKIHPGRLTWNLRIHPWKRRNIFQTIIFRFYVNLAGVYLKDKGF